ncbi:MAG: type II toxin-antitoxin system RelE/ParE family toxin [Desulfobacteraceae bacterium]|nr:MAG: type II toxin-antitoxin system RelE/ParE family toxin [Desulfobacteraceae bacterium]
METAPRIIQEYVGGDGKNHFSEWFDGLKDIKAQVKVDIRISRLRLGNFGDTKGVGQGVYELRIHFGPGYRVYYGLEGNTVILLLCGGDKGSQKKDIKKAVALWNEYQEGV